MSDPVDDVDELRQWRELFRRLVTGQKLMPWPEACQDVAFVAFVLSGSSHAEKLGPGSPGYGEVSPELEQTLAAMERLQWEDMQHGDTWGPDGPGYDEMGQ